ncbi:penicillin acylase family protein [candidate division KSB1 bacterium]|nr:penicillin acylase family protein [candidate division KSB1 bacterium]
MKRKYWAPVIFFICLLTVFFILTRRLIYKTLPETHSIQVSGLREKTEIGFDKFGIPNISASSSVDINFSMGFVHARDRLWQMDILRRAATGRLTEALGPSFLLVDTLMIKFNFINLAESLFVQLPDSIQNLLEAYSNGINAFSRSQQAAPAVEFQILDYLPKDWEPVHTLAIWQLWGWLNSYIRNDLLNFLLTIRIPENQLKIFNIDRELQIPMMLQHSFLNAGYEILTAIQKLDALTGLPRASEFSISRLWMEKNSGSSPPFLSFSPLSTLTIPNIWYLLQTTTNNACIWGATIPGIPVFFCGTNGQIAWSCEPLLVRNSYFQFYPVPSLQENNAGFQVIEQFVPLNKQDTLKISTYLKNGQPILYKNQDAEGQPYFWACNWTGFKPDSLFSKILNIGEIHSASLIQSSLPVNSTPAIQFSAIDKNDSIVFLKFGTSFMPVNPKKIKKLMAANSRMSFKFKSFLNLLSPEIIQLKFPDTHFQSDSILNLEPEFGREIWQKFYQTNGNPDNADLLKLAFIEKNLTCRFSSSAEQILPLLIHTLEKLSDSTEIKEVLYLLTHWDFYEHPHSYGATVFNLVMEKLISAIFQDEMGESLYSFFIQFPELVNQTMIKLLQDPENTWYDIQKTDSLKESLPDLLTPIISQLYSTKYSNNSVPNFLWKSQTPYRIQHLLTTDQSRDIYLNSAVIYLQGNGFPINYISQIRKASTSVKGWPLQIIFIPTDPIRAFWTISTGQSGHILSPNYKNATKSWLEGKYNTFNFSRTHFNNENTIILKPLRTIGTNL